MIRRYYDSPKCLTRMGKYESIKGNPPPWGINTDTASPTPLALDSHFALAVVVSIAVDVATRRVLF